MKALIRLDPNDNIAIALQPLTNGSTAPINDDSITLLNDIKLGHKVAIVDIPQGAKIRRNNVEIGSSTQAIPAGEHVHLHNLKSDYIPTLNKHYQDREVTP